ncbi:MAG: hypothetical protein F4X20_04860 [Dehalococcoidia bacterium]|nr:hypothetical protein [Dehalococcoidia bacterium]
MARHFLITVILALGAAHHSPASAQQCGSLSEKLCGYVSTTVVNWNERFGDAATIDTWRYIDTQEVVDAAALIALTETGDPVRVANLNSEDSIRLVPLPETVRERLYQAELAHVESFIGDGNRLVHRVALDWIAGNEQFNSVLVASDTSPFIFDRTLTSVVLESVTNSCFHLRLNWLWGIKRGEIYIDFAPYRESDPCAPQLIHWMNLGQANAKMPRSFYENGQCVGRYAWAYATPLGSFEFDIDAVSFAVSGLGSMGGGKGRCFKTVH